MGPDSNLTIVPVCDPAVIPTGELQGRLLVRKAMSMPTMQVTINCTWASEQCVCKRHQVGLLLKGCSGTVCLQSICNHVVSFAFNLSTKDDANTTLICGCVIANATSPPDAATPQLSRLDLSHQQC